MVPIWLNSSISFINGGGNGGFRHLIPIPTIPILKFNSRILKDPYSIVNIQHFPRLPWGEQVWLIDGSHMINWWCPYDSILQYNLPTAAVVICFNTVPILKFNTYPQGNKKFSKLRRYVFGGLSTLSLNKCGSGSTLKPTRIQLEENIRYFVLGSMNLSWSSLTPVCRKGARSRWITGSWHWVQISSPSPPQSTSSSWMCPSHLTQMTINDYLI